MLQLSFLPVSFVAPVGPTAAQQQQRVTMQTFDPIAFTKEMPGVSGPLSFFDPLGFCSGDARAGRVKFLREAELKHGRVAMLAAVGFVVAEGFHPLFGGSIDQPSFVAFQATPLQTFWPAVLAAIGAVEITTSALATFKPLDAGWWELKADYMPGELGFDPLGLAPADADGLKVMKTKEINNGRLAMLAIAGMVAQEAVTGAKLF